MLPTTAEKLQNFFGLFLQFQIGVDKVEEDEVAESDSEERVEDV